MVDPTAAAFLRWIDANHEMTYYLVMLKINIYEAKKHLSRYLERVRKGERIIVCKRNVPIAELRPLPAERKEPRPIGLAQGTFSVPPSFHEPLPTSVLDAFEGK